MSFTKVLDQSLSKILSLTSYVIISKLGKKGSILGEYVSPVIRRSSSNVTGNLKKAVGFEDYFLKILEFLSLAQRHLFFKGYRESIVSH